MTTITVDDDVLQDLKYLKNEIFVNASGKRFRRMNDVLRHMMDRLKYNQAFFERIREKVVE